MINVNEGSIVYCIVVTYNGMRWIDKCLSSLLHSTTPVQVVVVDNGSTDGTIDFVSSRYPMVRLVRSDSNIGFGRANNIGIRIALDHQANYFFLLNQDAWVAADALDQLLNVARSDPSFYLLSPLHLQADGKHLDGQFARYISPPRSSFYPELFAGEGRNVYECEFVNAAAWLLTRDCILKVGLFEPLFFIYGEDQNYVQRVRYHGGKVGVVPASRIVHDRMDRKGAKNRLGSKIEVDTYILIKLLDPWRGFISCLLNSGKAFVRFNDPLRTAIRLLWRWTQAAKIIRLRGQQRKYGYLLD